VAVFIDDVSLSDKRQIGTGSPKRALCLLDQITKRSLVSGNLMEPRSLSVMSTSRSVAVSSI
jgi:hypothetical protein